MPLTGSVIDAGKVRLRRLDGADAISGAFHGGDDRVHADIGREPDVSLPDLHPRDRRAIHLG
jgi:hypothetical protein